MGGRSEKCREADKFFQSLGLSSQKLFWEKSILGNQRTVKNWMSSKEALDMNKKRMTFGIIDCESSLGTASSWDGPYSTSCMPISQITDWALIVVSWGSRRLHSKSVRQHHYKKLGLLPESTDEKTMRRTSTCCTNHSTKELESFRIYTWSISGGIYFRWGSNEWGKLPLVEIETQLQGNKPPYGTTDNLTQSLRFM